MRILLLIPSHHEGRERAGDRVLEGSGQGNLPFFPVPGLAPFQPQSFWIRALEKLGHQVRAIAYTTSILAPNGLRVRWERFEEKIIPAVGNIRRALGNRTAAFSPEIRARNILFLKVARKFKPQLILVSGGSPVVSPGLIKTLKAEFGSRAGLMHGSSPLTSVPELERKMLEHIDAVFLNDPLWVRDWLRLGAKEAYALPIAAMDPEYHKAAPEHKDRDRSGIVFVGRLSPYRLAVLKALKDFPLRVFGIRIPGVEIPREIKDKYVGDAWGGKMVGALAQAKIALNLHEPEMPGGGNLRTFEIAGAGAFQLTDRNRPEWFVQDREIVCFNDLEELRTLAEFYLGHDSERELIAAAGHQRALREHTYVQRFEKILEILESLSKNS